MDFYHVTERALLASIRSEGLRPQESRDAAVFLWDSLQVAEFEQASHPLEDPVMLKVSIPRSWTLGDDGYYVSEAGRGHAWKCARIIPPDRIQMHGPAGWTSIS